MFTKYAAYAGMARVNIDFLILKQACMHFKCVNYSVSSRINDTSVFWILQSLFIFNLHTTNSQLELKIVLRHENLLFYFKIFRWGLIHFEMVQTKLLL